MSTLQVVLEPGIAQKLQFAVNRNGGTLEDIDYLSTGKNFRAVTLLRTGKAKLVEVTPPAVSEVNTLIRVDRSVKPTYPDWLQEILHPELEGAGPAEYDMTKVELQLHDDQKDGGYTTGHKIYEHIKATDSLRNYLGLDDALAIQKNGIAAFRKAFGYKVVVCWRSVARRQCGGLIVPYVCSDGDGVVVFWGWLGNRFSSGRPAGCFAQ